MPKPTTDDNASSELTPQKEIAQIEQAQESEAGKAEQPEKTQEPTAFEKLAEVKGFDSVEDLVESYKNLEAKLAPQTRELKELRSMVEEIKESTTPKPEDPYADLPQEQREAVSLLEKIVARQLDQRLSPIVEQAEVDRAKSKIQAIKETYPEITNDEIDQALEVMKQYTRMSLDEAVKIVSFDRTYGKLQKVNQKTASNQQNKKAFAESASEARKEDNLDYSKMTLEELEEIIPR